MEKKWRKTKCRLLLLVGVAAVSFLIPWSVWTAAAAKPLKKVKWAYIGVICESAVYAAKEKGFWKDLTFIRPWLKRES